MSLADRGRGDVYNPVAIQHLGVTFERRPWQRELGATSQWIWTLAFRVAFRPVEIREGYLPYFTNYDKSY